MPGLWLPYHDLEGLPILENGKPYGRLRLDLPVGDKKYHQAAGTSVHIYIPLGLRRLSLSDDLVVVEGEFKSLALVEAGIPAVGISGFYGFRTKKDL